MKVKSLFVKKKFVKSSEKKHNLNDFTMTDISYMRNNQK